MTQAEIGALKQRVRELELAVVASDGHLAIAQREWRSSGMALHLNVTARIDVARAILTRAMESI